MAESAAKAGAKRPHGSGGTLQNSERRGRRPNQDKIDQADQHELVLPNGFDLSQCDLVMDCPVWRIRSGHEAKQKTNSADETDCEFDNLMLQYADTASPFLFRPIDLQGPNGPTIFCQVPSFAIEVSARRAFYGSLILLPGPMAPGYLNY